MPLVSLLSLICSCCPWWEMGTVRNFSSNLSYLGLKLMLVGKGIESAVCEQSLLLTEVVPNGFFFSCHFCLLAISFTPLPSGSCLTLSSPDPSQLLSLFPCLHCQRHSWSPLGLHSHDENTHYCISRQFPKMRSYLRAAWWWLVAGATFTGHAGFLVPMLARWCTLP